MSPLDHFKHEVRHLMLLLYAPISCASLRGLTLEHFPSLSNLEEARVILSTDNDLSFQSTKPMRLSHIGRTATFEQLDSNESSIAYYDHAKNSEKYLYSDHDLTGYVSSIEGGKASILMPHGDADFYIDALAQHSFHYIGKDGESIEQSIERTLKEAQTLQQPITIRLLENGKNRMPSMEISRHTLGTATILPTLEKNQQLRIQQGCIARSLWKDIPPPNANDIRWQIATETPEKHKISSDYD
jgi:hypothetical protein